MPYKSDKDRTDRLRNQKKYYYNHRNTILLKLKRKRLLKIESEPSAEQQLLLDLYYKLRDYLVNENLI